MAGRAEAKAGDETIVDGRVQRGERNRGRIVDALIALVQEGVLQPTAEQVAKRAAVGTRTVFRHFEDMDSLNAEINERVRCEVLPLFAEPIRGGLAQRVQELVRRRGQVFERIAPYRRAGALIRWRSPFLQNEHRRMVRELRAQLLAVLPELDDAPAPVFDSVDLLTSFEAWERLRCDQRLGRERAQESIATSVLALLEQPR